LAIHEGSAAEADDATSSAAAPTSLAGAGGSFAGSATVRLIERGFEKGSSFAGSATTVRRIERGFEKGSYSSSFFVVGYALRDIPSSSPSNSSSIFLCSIE
jgi:hypothetical protein